MRQFIKSLLAVILGNAIFFGLFILTFFIIILGISLCADDEKTVEKDSILKINIPDNLSELPSASDDPFEWFDSEKSVCLYHITQAINSAQTDNKIKGILIPLSYSEGATYSELEIIRNAIIEFKKSGKPVFSYGEVASQKSYYLASVADKIFLNPNGMIDLRGFGAEITFFKGMLDKLEIQPQIFYAGKFKSATEPFRFDKMSEENKAQTRELLQDIKRDIWNDIAQSRKIDTSILDLVANQMLSSDPEELKKNKLIDEIAYFDQVELAIKKAIKLQEDKNLVITPLNTYISENTSKTKEGKIAVYIAEGNIMDSKSSPGIIGSKTMAKDLKELRNNKKVKGVVIRINSTGGSALASGTILREVELLAKEKPVAVSMGSVAASGGYYIAMGSERIFAEENTITGSIGVFSIIPNLQKMLNNKLGISTDEVELNTHAVMGINKPFDSEEAARAKLETERIYQTFKNVVSKGRKMNIDNVELLAQGKVYSARKAKEIGLVDEIGGLKDAVKFISNKINTSDEYYFANQQPSWVEKLKMNSQNIRLYIKNKLVEFISDWLGLDVDILLESTKINRYKSPQTKMYFDINIK